MAAAEACAADAERRLLSQPHLPPHVAITVPVLVLDGDMYLYGPDSDDEDSVTQITEAKLSAPQRPFEARCLLSIVTADAFAEWLERFANHFEPVLDAVLPMAPLIPETLVKHRHARESSA
jgi:hypothetical protein